MLWGTRMVEKYRARFIAKNREWAYSAECAFQWCIFAGEPDVGAAFLVELKGAGHDKAVTAICDWLEPRPWVVYFGFVMPEL